MAAHGSRPGRCACVGSTIQSAPGPVRFGQPFQQVCDELILSIALWAVAKAGLGSTQMPDRPARCCPPLSSLPSRPARGVELVASFFPGACSASSEPVALTFAVEQPGLHAQAGEHALTPPVPFVGKAVPQAVFWSVSYFKRLHMAHHPSPYVLVSANIGEPKITFRSALVEARREAS